MIDNLRIRGSFFLNIAIACIAFSQASVAQTNYKVGGHSVINLKGVSAVHNWGMEAHSFLCKATFTVTTGNQLASIDRLSLRLPVHNLKGESAEIDKKALKALKADDFENITFELTSATLTPGDSNTYHVIVNGNLTVAGVTQQTALNATATLNADNSISFDGITPLSLADFHIKRPSLMFGAIKVGDAMTLNYNLLFVKFVIHSTGGSVFQ